MRKKIFLFSSSFKTKQLRGCLTLWIPASIRAANFNNKLTTNFKTIMILKNKTKLAK